MSARLALLSAVWLGLSLAAPVSAAGWRSVWSAPPTEAPAELAAGGRTIRQTVTVTGGGPTFRLRFSNAEGVEALDLGAVVADGAPVTFAGRRTARIAPGAPLFSDRVVRPLKPGQPLEVRLFLPDPKARPTVHW